MTIEQAVSMFGTLCLLMVTLSVTIGLPVVLLMEGMERLGVPGWVMLPVMLAVVVALTTAFVFVGANMGYVSVSGGG